MNELLKNKIKELYLNGYKTTESIISALNSKPKIEKTRQVARPLYQLELAFKTMVLQIVGADVMTFLQLSSDQREVFIKQKIDIAFTNAIDSDGKIAALKTGLELQNLKALLEKSGSQLFSDPNFAAQYATEYYYDDGPSWLEENNATSPSEEEVRQAILS